MEDEKIISLFFSRCEQAISALSDKYGRLCYSIAFRILSSKQDAEECENDTYLRVWNSVPPTYPQSLRAYVSRIVRNLAITRLHYNNRKKRSRSNNIDILFSELSECIPSAVDVEASADDTIQNAINSFLEKQEPQIRVLFIRRYFFGEDIVSLSARFSLKESNISTKLNRTRARLKDYLEKEGIVL